MLNAIKISIITFTFSTFIGCANEKLINYSIPLSKIINSAKYNEKSIYILIDKSDYVLNVKIDTVILKQYPVVFGGNPIKDKRMKGDNCTPEGIFKVRTKYEHKKWSKFIWIDYPNDESWRKHNLSKQNGEIPKNAQIGGEIGIHGVVHGADFLISVRRNWTLGCVSMKNQDIEELYPFINSKTLVEIIK